jgi:hypothetical protein
MIGLILGSISTDCDQALQNVILTVFLNQRHYYASSILIKTSSSTARANLLVLKLIMNFFRHGRALYSHQISLNIRLDYYSF